MKPQKSAIESNSKIGMGPSLYYGHRGGWSRKWQFPLTLCSENVLTYVGGWFKKATKHPYVI